MIVCPHCGAENLEGSDLCDDCQHSLTDMSYPEPKTSIEAGLLEDRIDILSPREPITATPDMTVGQVIDMMVHDSVGCAIIVDGDQLVGIFSERDALVRVNADIDQMRDKPVRELMTPNPVTLKSTDKIAFALHKMHVGGLRHLPILKKGKLQGVISIRDILGYLAQRIKQPA